jgi:hypothetical protein
MVDALNERPLVVGLKAIDAHFQVLGPAGDHLIDLLEGRSAIDFWLSGTQSIQIWAM